MKNLLITCLLLILASGVQSQPLHDDTVVCIIDTTKSYVHYQENVVEREIPTPFPLAGDHRRSLL
jgi:hypothetical protein